MINVRNLRTEQDIMQAWNPADKPLVSVACITFNHEHYIEQAIQSFLIQETDFPFEIIIHDDASIDNTAEIVREYANKYPKIIRSILQNENQHSQGKRAILIVTPQCKGKYIAVCEGDDFWTDGKKLQIQVDFLESNPDYVISGHDAFIIDENGNHIKDSKLPNSHKRDYSGEELIMDKAWILTMSWVYRNLIKDYPPERSMVVNGDNFFISLIGHFGKSKYHPEIKPAGYRVHPGGVWSMRSDKDKRDSKINTWFWMYRYYTRVGEEKFAKHFWFKYSVSVITHTPSGVLLRELFIRWLQLRKMKYLTTWVLAKVRQNI